MPRRPSALTGHRRGPLAVDCLGEFPTSRSSLQTATNPNRRRRTVAAMVRCSNGLLGLLNAGGHKDSVMEIARGNARELLLVDS
ncbi:hypothetical protein EJB05_21894 [Eragrostis curvula]|uniref:Uncharacterized protein n=1 Tax=Eragrostis curvula TaxID=38414 RepID=A0A5J9V428_9POAL|nr:hypothetical protein EJB05_21894 [Eragrostis curvula]